jgi:hypothetical protein
VLRDEVGRTGTRTTRVVVRGAAEGRYQTIANRPAPKVGAEHEVVPSGRGSRSSPSRARWRCNGTRPPRRGSSVSPDRSSAGCPGRITRTASQTGNLDGSREGRDREEEVGAPSTNSLSAKRLEVGAERGLPCRNAGRGNRRKPSEMPAATKMDEGDPDVAARDRERERKEAPRSQQESDEVGERTTAPSHFSIRRHREPFPSTSRALATEGPSRTSVRYSRSGPSMFQLDHGPHPWARRTASFGDGEEGRPIGFSRRTRGRSRSGRATGSQRARRAASRPRGHGKGASPGLTRWVSWSNLPGDHRRAPRARGRRPAVAARDGVGSRMAPETDGGGASRTSGTSPPGGSSAASARAGQPRRPGRLPPARPARPVGPPRNARRASAAFVSNRGSIRGEPLGRRKTARADSFVRSPASRSSPTRPGYDGSISTASL